MNKVAVLGVGWGKMDKNKTDKVAVLEVKSLVHIHFTTPPKLSSCLFCSRRFTLNAICVELGYQQDSAVQKKMAL